MAKTTPTSLRLNDDFKVMCAILMYVRRFGDRTAFVEQLLRDEWDRRGGDDALLKFKDKALAVRQTGRRRPERNVNYLSGKLKRSVLNEGNPKQKDSASKPKPTPAN